jgi:hypothetical protein
MQKNESVSIWMDPHAQLFKNNHSQGPFLILIGIVVQGRVILKGPAFEVGQGESICAGSSKADEYCPCKVGLIQACVSIFLRVANDCQSYCVKLTIVGCV